MFFPRFNEFVAMFLSAVGHECGELEGCCCHRELNVGVDSYRKRRQAMIETIGAPICPWKGKNIVPLTLGHIPNVVVPRVKGARSVGVALALAVAPRVVAARVLEVEVYIKDFWCANVVEKGD